MNFNDLDEVMQARIIANAKALGSELLDCEEVCRGNFRLGLEQNAFIFLPFVSLNFHLKEKLTKKFALFLTEQEAMKLAAQIIQRVSEIREKNNGLS